MNPCPQMNAAIRSSEREETGDRFYFLIAGKTFAEISRVMMS